jgi:hypothetical protein
MPDYRLHLYDKDGKPFGPAWPIRADDDEAVLAIVQKYVDGQDWMLCDGTRLVKEVRQRRA